MQILKITAGPVATNAYLVFDDASKSSVIIDAPLDCFDFFVAEINDRQLQLNAVWLTHSHWDHTADADKLVKHFLCDLYINKLDEYRCLEPNNYVGFDFGIKFDPCTPNKYYSEGEIMNIGGNSFELLHTPGHTEGSICFINHANKIIFAGDVLFKGSVGRTDLYGGNHGQLINSINTKLMALPDEYIVFNGHGEETTIGSERQFNPFL